MDKKFGYYIFGGMLIGVFLGLIWAADRNAVVGIAIGALVGASIGWFAAADVMEKEKERKQTKHRQQ